MAEKRINIVNKRFHKSTKNDFYIGRGSPLGNPFSHKKGTKAIEVVSTREEAISLYEEYILYQISNRNENIIAELQRIMNHLKHHGEINLVCYCAPHLCHGDVLKRFIEAALTK